MRSGAFFILALGVLLLAPAVAAVPVPVPGFGPAQVAAQEPDSLPSTEPEPPRIGPTPPDTIGRPMRGDTLLRDTLPADTLGPPPPRLPTFEPLEPASFAAGVWEWDRKALLMLPDLSVIHLLERIPGLVPVRADIVNQPESVALFGAAAGAIRYVVDGFELDPLVGATFDASRLPLLALESVRVERRVTGATVHLRTVTPEDPRPRTWVEAATGDFGINLFRGVFLGPEVLGGPLALGFERLAANGARRVASNHLAGWAKWSWIRGSSGMQIEYRQSDMDRDGFGFEGSSGARRDWVVRARTARGPVTGEIYAGASRVEDDRGELIIQEGTPIGGLRLRGDMVAPVPMEFETAIRLREHPRLPFAEIELGARAVPIPLVGLEAEAVRGWWGEGTGTGRWTARARVGPLLGLTAFSEIFGGAPFLHERTTLRVPSVDSASLRLTRTGLRVGAGLRYRGLAVSGAAIRATADSVAGFGLPTELGLVRGGGGEATGFEVMAGLPTGWDPLRVEGWYVGMEAPSEWLYVPDHHWRAGLVYHHLPLPSGNLELFLRAEHVFRGRMTVPGAIAAPEEPVTEPTPNPEVDPAPLRTEVGAYRATNLELTIRVLTVRAFLRWENITNRHSQRDLPGFPLPGQHIVYGVKWEFRN